MKNSLVILIKQIKLMAAIMLFLVSTQGAKAQTLSSPPNRFNAITLSFATKAQLSLNYEKTISNNSSLLVGLSRSNQTSRTSDFVDGWKRRNTIKEEGTQFRLAFRLYLFNKNRPQGFYAQPYLQWGRYDVQYDTVDSDYDYWWIVIPVLSQERRMSSQDKLSTYGGGIKLGYQNRWKALVYNFGVAWSVNRVSGRPAGMQMQDGTYSSFSKNLNGNTASVYLGLGYSF